MNQSLDAYRITPPQTPCPCGREHQTQTDFVILEENIGQFVGSVLNYYGVKRAAYIFDNITQTLSQNFLQLDMPEMCVFQTICLTRENALVPDERAVFEILSQVSKEADGLIAVGSGTINDLTRYVADKLKLPYFCIATAPSMDGFVSAVSPLNVLGTKITYPAAPPKAVLADLNVLCQAPMPMIAAGAGDILGKFTALADWKLSRRLKGEYYCPQIVEMVSRALGEVVDSIDGLTARDSQAIQKLMNALVLSGSAISYASSSRPASGAEHHLSHYFELLYIREKRLPVFHGTKVALGLLMVLEAYRFFESDSVIAEIAQALPPVQQVCGWMKALGLPRLPSEIGLTQEETYQGLLHARELRDRFTIMDYAYEKGCLEQTAHFVMNQIEAFNQ